MKRSHKLFIIVLLQVLFLFGMIGFKYYTLQNGTPVLLKTAPVDPWDVFRGEYVRLGYEISRLESGKIQDNIKEKTSIRDKTVYVVLEKGEKFWQAVSISLNKPGLGPDQVFIKGKVNYYDDYRKEYFLTYGIESYYVQEGEGVKLERLENLEVLVKVDRFGNAGIGEVIVPKQ